MGKFKKTQKQAAPQSAAESIKSNMVRRDVPTMKLGIICQDPRNIRRQEITPENDSKLLELADSIKQFGDVIEPIVVRLRPEESLGDYFPDCLYMLISGHRRLAAAKLAGLETIHCSVWENITDAQAFEMQLIENLHRADLCPVEEAEAYKRMKDELGYNYAEIALRVGKSEKHIGRYIKLLSLPSKILEMIDAGELTLSKALFLCSMSERIIDEIINSSWRSAWLENRYSFKEFKTRILQNFILELSDEHVKFDLKEKYTDADGYEWPACSKCPHKKQMALFEEFDGKGQCPFAPCFSAKQDLIEDAVEQEEDYSGDNDSDGKTSRKLTTAQKAEQVQSELENKIKDAVDRQKAIYYIEKKIAQGFSFDDLAEYTDINDLDEENDDIFLKFLGKDKKGIMESNDYELFIKAAVIDCVANRADWSYGEDQLLEALNCDKCPEELLDAARDEVIGINKKPKKK